MAFGESMKEFMLLILFLIIVGSAMAGYKGVSNTIKLYYMCGVEVPVYAAAFLDPNQCPTHGKKIDAP